MRTATPMELFHSWPVSDVTEVLSEFGCPPLDFAATFTRGAPALYFLIYRGCVVYVGQSRDLPSRLEHHRQAKRWNYALAMDAPTHEDRRLQVERAVIRALHPPYNVVGNDGPREDSLWQAVKLLRYDTN